MQLPSWRNPDAVPPWHLVWSAVYGHESHIHVLGHVVVLDSRTLGMDTSIGHLWGSWLAALRCCWPVNEWGDGPETEVVLELGWSRADWTMVAFLRTLMTCSFMWMHTRLRGKEPRMGEMQDIEISVERMFYKPDLQAHVWMWLHSLFWFPISEECLHLAHQAPTSQAMLLCSKWHN